MKKKKNTTHLSILIDLITIIIVINPRDKHTHRQAGRKSDGESEKKTQKNSRDEPETGTVRETNRQEADARTGRQNDRQAQVGEERQRVIQTET